MDDIWEILKEHNFLITNMIGVDLFCILCKKILIDARIGPCGCRYCKICIENHLKNGENICPGSTDQCNEEYLNLIKNINIDHVFNKKMSKMKFYCPIESCQFSDQIINMKQHLIGCREIAIKCSFYENGCNFISLSGDNVDKHCKMSKDKHLELVLTRNENLKNINNIINKNQIELQQENEKLKAENDKDKDLLKQNEIVYNKLKTQNEIQTKQIADYKNKIENEITYKNKLIKYFSDLTINLSEFVWNFDKFSKMKDSIDETYQSEKFFIFKDNIRMQLSLGYYTDHSSRFKGAYKYRLGVKASHRITSLNGSCPLICNISVVIVNKIGGSYIFSCDERKTFNSSGISFDKDIPEDQIENEIIDEDCLIVRCIMKLSL